MYNQKFRCCLWHNDKFCI